jgi:hypothetical protein
MFKLNNRQPIDEERAARYARWRDKSLGWAWHGKTQEAMTHLGEPPTEAEVREFEWVEMDDWLNEI